MDSGWRKYLKMLTFELNLGYAATTEQQLKNVGKTPVCNLILNTDSYKHSHFLQYPPNTEYISSYIEARENSDFDYSMFFGLQAFLKETLSKPITQVDIAEAEMIVTAHGLPFNRRGWQMILDKHAGFLPIEIQALPEGSVVRAGTPMVQVVNTDPEFAWVTSFIETALLRAVWYPSTVATISWLAKQAVLANLVETCDDGIIPSVLPFRLHDFGARGVSSEESAALGGLAHLVNFQGSDTMGALLAARNYYGESMASFSLSASEHSTMTSWGPANEVNAYRNMLTQFAKPGSLLAVVSDSYDLDFAVNKIWGGALKDEVIKSGATVVIRPDSGDPVATPIKVIEDLAAAYGTTTNTKGYKVLNPAVRVIQGDGMELHTIKSLLHTLQAKGFSGENIAFGMGGGLLQKLNRDTLRFAMKANAIKANGATTWTDVSKKPSTDPTKNSKAGRLAVVDVLGRATTVAEASVKDGDKTLLNTVWSNGNFVGRETTLSEVRMRSLIPLI